jgi:VCBS repeat-containing protein
MLARDRESKARQSASEVMAKTPSTSKKAPAPSEARASLSLIALEQRIAFDGAMTDTFANEMSDSEAVAAAAIKLAAIEQSSADMRPAERASPIDPQVEIPPREALSSLAGIASSSAQTEILFIDGAVEDPTTLMSGIRAGVEVVFLDSKRDGVEQIAAALADRNNISAVHIISHGNEGELSLGTSTLNLQTMAGQYASQLTNLRNALTDEADILIYGCDFASGENGRLAAQFLGALTGADITASDDMTGHENLGGDWDLEVIAGGGIEARIAFDRSAISDWAHVLPGLTVPSVSTITGQITDVFQLNGVATNITTFGSNTRVIQLTPDLNAQVGSAWSKVTLDLTQNFAIDIDIFLGVNNTGADGIGFALHADPRGTSATGTAGGGLGVRGIDNAVAIEFDTYNNGTSPTAFKDIADDHISIFRAGTGNLETILSNGGTVQSLGDVEDGKWYDCKISWNAATNTLNYAFDGPSGIVSSSAVINPAVYFAGATDVYFGFAGSTGGSKNLQMVSFNDILPSFRPSLDLDGNNSSGSTGRNYTGSFTEGGGSVRIADTDLTLVDVDTATLDGMTIRLTNAQLGDVLSLSAALPSGIASAIDTSIPGEIRLNLSGSATLANYRTALDLVRFNNTSDTPVATQRVIEVVAQNSISITSLPTYSYINITSINDAPINTVPVGWSGLEDSSGIALTGLSIADADAGAGNMSITLSVPSGSLTASNAGGVTVTGSGTGSLVLTGTLTNLNTYLASASRPNFLPAANQTSSVILTMVTNDNGNGGGAAATDSDTVTITLTPVNDAPVNMLPATFGAESAATITLSGISIADIDAASGNITVTLSVPVSGGSLNLSTSVPGGVTAGQVTGNNSRSITVTAPLAAINATLANTNGLRYTAPAATGNYTLTVATQDLGNTGGGNLTDNDTSTITVAAASTVNYAPVNNLPAAAWTTGEDVPFNITGLSVTDVDIGTGNASVTLSVGSGTLTLLTNISGGLSAGQITSGNGTATVVITAPLSAINTTFSAVNGLVFTPASNTSGSVTFQIVTNDQNTGSQGTGGAKQDTDTKTITVTSVNDIPVLASGATTSVGFTENGSAVAIAPTLTISDNDNSSFASATVTITNFVAGQDILGFVGTGSTGNIAGVYNSTTGVLTLTSAGATASAAQWRAALRSVTYNNSSDAPVTTSRSVAISLNDGAGSSVPIIQTVTVAILNDAPVNTLPAAAWITDEDTALALTGVSVADVDIGTGKPTVIITVASGFLVLRNDVSGGIINGIGGVTVTGNGTTSIQITGATVAEINATLAASNGLLFNPSANLVGGVNFSIATNDNNVTAQGTGGALSTTTNKTITINAINDAPVVTNPSAVIFTENGAAQIINNALTVADLDTTTLISATVTIGNFASGDILDVTLNSGTMGNIAKSWNSTTGVLTLTSSGGTATLSQWEIALRAVSYRNTSEAPPATTRNIVFQVNDGQSTNALSNTLLSTVAMVTVNDAPAGTNATLTLLEDGTHTFSAANFGFSDVDGNALQDIQITTLPSNGTIQLSGVAVSAGDWIPAASIGSLTYTPAANSNGAALTSFTFTVRDNGGTANSGVDTDASPNTITFDVTAVNDTPVVASAIPNQSIDEDTAWSYVVPAGTFTDVDNSINYSATLDTGAALPSWLTFNDVTRTFSGTPPLNFNGTIGLRITASDGTLSAFDDFVLTVNPVNDAPVGVADIRTESEDIRLSVAAASGLLINDTDADGNSLTITQFTVAGVAGSRPAGSTLDIPNIGALTINANGSYVFEPAYNFTGTVPLITYSVSDGQGGTATTTLTLTISPVNDAPFVNLGSGTNLLVNGGFDSPLMSNFNTNNILGTSWGGWTAVGGNINVLQVNGSAYASGADTANTGTQYVDLDNPGSLVQSFTLANTTTIAFGAAFNHRELSLATNRVEIRDAGGALVASTGTVTFLGTSGNELWIPANGVASLGAGTYTINILLGDNAHADSAFVRITGHEATFTENGAAVSIGAPGLSITDPDNAMLQSATITLTDRQANDLLTAGSLPVGISASAYNPATGVITLSGTASLADYQTAIQAITFSNPSDTLSNADRHVSVTVSDGALLSNTAVSVIHVIAVNDAPVITTTATATFTEGDSPLAIASASTILTDLDDTNMESATIVLTNARPNDVLSILGILPAGITAVIDTSVANQITVTLSGSAPVADYRTAITQVAFLNTAQNPSTAARTFNITTSDGTDVSNTAVVTMAVVRVNDNPVLGTAGATSYTENDAPVTVASGITVADVDNANLSSATVTITNYVAGQDTLAFTNSAGMGNISGNVVAGVLTLNSAGGTATTAEWQAALRAVTYVNSSENPTTTTRTIAFQINDGRSVNNLSNILNSTVTIANVNDAPVLSVAGSISYTENDPATAIDTGITLTDNDSGTFASATVTLANYVSSQDTLGFTNDLLTMGNITALFNSGTGVLTLTSAGRTATTSEWQAALRAVTYVNSSNAPNTATRNVDFRISDGEAANSFSNILRSTISITSVNDAPDARNDLFTLNEDSTLAFPSVFANNGSGADSDADGDSLTVSLHGGVAPGTPVVGSNGGTMTFNNATAGTFSFTPGSSFQNLDDGESRDTTFTYDISDGNGGTDQATVTIRVTGVNDLAISSNTSVTTNEDTAHIFTLSDFPFSDADSADILQNIRIDTLPTDGSIRLNGVAVSAGASISRSDILAGRLSFNPDLNENGVSYTSFTFSVGDGTAFSASPYTMTVDVTSVNDAPTGTDTTITVNEDTAHFFSAADFGFTDSNDMPANTLVQIRIDTLPSTGTLSFGGSIVYVGDEIIASEIPMLSWTPASNSNGASVSSFTFTVFDDGGTANGGLDTDASPNTITFDVTAINDAPVINAPATINGTEDTSLTITSISLTDVDSAANNVTVTFSIPSGTGVINWSNTAPIIASGTGTQTLTLTGSITDINAAVAASKLSVMPAANDNGSVQLTINVNDGGNIGSGGAKQDSFVTNLIFAAVNDAPVVANALNDQSFFEEQFVSFALPANSFEDVDSTLSYTAELDAGGPLPAWLSFNAATRTFEGTPPANFNGNIAIKVSVNDGEFTTSDTFTLTIVSVNDAPTGTDKTITFDEDTTYTFSAADFGFTDVNDSPANTLLQIRFNSIPTSGQFLINGSAIAVGDWINASDLDQITWTPDLNAFGAALASFTFTVQDDGGTAFSGVDIDPTPNMITFNVTPVNDAPVAPVIAAQSNVDSAVVSLNLAFSDVDSPSLTYAATGLPAGLSIDSVTGLITGTIASSASRGGAGGVYNVQVQANDGTGNITSTTFTWTVTNPAPNAVDNLFTTNEDTGFTASLIGNDSDPDGDTFAIDTTPVTAPTLGSVVINANGTFTYTPTSDANGQDSFSYRIIDADGAIDIATVTINITPVNDAPLSVTLPARASNDSDVIAINLGSTFSDVEGDTITYTISGLPPGLNYNTATGAVTGTINHSASQGGVGGVYSIAVTANDGNGGVTVRNFNWTVSNPAPVARADDFATGQNTATSGSVFNNNGSGTDFDPDGDTFVVSAVGGLGTNVNVAVLGSNGGLFTINADGAFSFDPDGDFIDVAVGATRNTTLTYTISDGEGGTSIASVTVTVSGINDAPTAATIGNQAHADSAVVNLPLGPIFFDPDYDALTFTQTGLPPGLMLNAATGVISGTIASSASQGGVGGVYTVEITADDQNGGVISRSFTWTITNPAPTAVNDSLTVNEDSGTTIINILSNDTDPDGDIQTVVSATAANGTVVINGNGTLSYTPNLNFNGPDTISYTMRDADGATSSAQVLVTVAPVNDAPTSTAIPTQAGSDGGTVSLDTSAYFTDVDIFDPNVPVSNRDSLEYTATGLPPGLFINATTGVISGVFPSNASLTSPYTVEVTATDESGLTSVRTFSWNVANLSPEAAPDAVTMNEDAGSVTVHVTFNDSDPDGDSFALINDAGSFSAANGTVTVNPATGEVTYTPNLNFNGIDTVTYTIRDSDNAESVGTLTVTVNPTNDAPTTTGGIPSANSLDNQAVSINAAPYFTDLDLSDTPADVLTYSATGLPTGLTINTTTGVISGTIDRGASGTTGTNVYNVIVTARDSANATVNNAFNWTITNPTPTATNDATTTDEDIAKTITVLTNDTDTDGDTLVVDLASAGHGSVVINGNGSLTYTPDPNFNGTDTINYRITDGNGGYSTASISVTINPINDNPTSTTINNRSANDSDVINISINSFFDDVDMRDQTPDVLTYLATGLPAGLMLDTNTGTISGTILRNASQDFAGGVHSVIVTATDVAGLSTARTFSWTILNPSPIALVDSTTGNEDTIITGSLGNDTDPDGDPLTYDTSPVIAPAHGSVVILANGTYTYTPNLNFNGTDTFTYRVRDDDGGSATAVVTITVNPVNDNPVANPNTATTNEDTLVNIIVLGNDSDVDAGDSLSVTTASALHGTVTILGNGSLNYTPDLNYGGSDTITYSISDGKGGSATSTVNVTINPVNDNPVAVANAVSTPEDTLRNFDPRIGDSDVDGDALTITHFDGQALTTGVAVTITDGATTVGTITRQADGTLTFMPALNYFGAKSFSYTINDGNGGTAQSTVMLTVTPVNDAPVATAAPLSTPEDTAQDGVINVTDVDGGAPSFAVLTAPSHGTIVVRPDGTYTYTPTLNFNGTDSFEVEVTDGAGGVTTIIVPVTVTAVNDAPVVTLAAPDRFVDEDTAFSFVTPITNFSDVDGDTLTLTATLSNGAALPSWINFNPATGAFTGTPPSNFHGNLDIKVTASDGASTPLAVSDVFRLTINPVNDAPVGANGSLSTNEDTVFSGTLPVATDVDGDILTYSTGSITAAHGTVIINANGTFSYTPDANYNGPDSFTYSVSDGVVTRDYSMAVTIIPVNDAPEITSENVTTNEDTSLVINVLDNDIDIDGDSLSITHVNGQAISAGASVSVTGGSIRLNIDGTLTFTPTANYSGTPNFNYTASDGIASAIGLVNVTVNPVNDAPVLASPLPDVSSTEDQLVTITIPAGTFTDSDGPAATYSATLVGGAPLPTWLTFNPATRTLSGTPPLDYNGEINITVRASDGSLFAEDSFKLTINPVNDAPVALNGSFTTDEDATYNGTLPIATDVDGDTLSYSIGNSLPAHGTILINADGTFSYQGNSNYSGTDSFSYFVSDGNISVERTISVIVNPVNDAPVVAIAIPDVAFDEEQPVSITISAGTFTDIDGPAATYSATLAGGAALPPWLSFNSATRTLSGTPPVNFNGTLDITVRASDGTSFAEDTFNLTINPVNDAPVGLNGSFSTNEDTDYSGTLPVATDIDGDTLSYALNNAATHGTVVVNNDGTFTYTPAANYSGSDSFQYSISDGAITINYVMNITVNPVNDAPVTADDSITTNEDTAVTFDPRLNDSDIEDDALTITHANGVALITGTSVAILNGTITREIDGRLTFTPDPDFVGSSSFTYTISDGNGGLTNGMVNLTVNPVNDAPTATSPAIAPDEDTPIDGVITAVDIDGDTLTYNVNTAPSHGTLVVRPDGSYTYTPAPNYVGADSFTVLVSDGNGGQVLISIPVTVSAVNDAPVTTVDSVSTNEVTSVTFDPRLNDSDVEGNSLTITHFDGIALVTETPVAVTGGTITLEVDGQLTFTPDLNYNGSSNFTYTVSDGNGGISNGTVNLIVNPVNDAPTATSPSITPDEDTPIDGVITASDIDGDSLTYSVNTAPLHGTLVVRPDGTYTYTPTFNYVGTDNFTILVSDGNGGQVVVTIPVTVSAVNDAPVVNGPLPDVTVVEDQPVSITLASNAFADVDNATLSFTATLTDGSPLPSWLSFDASTQSFTGTPPLNYFGTIAITIRATDGSLYVEDTFNLTVAAQNDAPIGADSSFDTTEDTLQTGQLPIATDIDGDQLVYSLHSQASHGSVIVNPDGSYSYLPNMNYFGTDRFEYSVSDGTIAVTYRIDITVNPVNDAPVAADDAVSTAQNISVIFDLRTNDRDSEGDTLSVTAINGQPLIQAVPLFITGGSLTLEADGRITFTPEANYLGLAFFSATISDASGASTTSRFSITVFDESPAQQPTTPAQPEDLNNRPSTTFTERTDDLVTIEDQGVIVDAMNEISELNGSYKPLGLDRPLLTAVNGIKQLNTPHHFQIDGRIVDPLVIAMQGNLGQIGTNAFYNQTSGLDLASRNTAAITSETRLTFQNEQHVGVSISVKRDSVSIKLRETGIINSEVCRKWVDVQQLDGNILPEWLKLMQDGEYAGQPPEGQETLNIKIIVRLEDGTEVERKATINLKTGEITPIQKQSDLQTPDALFSQQLAKASGSMGDQQSNIEEDYSSLL